MELWELNDCVKEYNLMQKESSRLDTTRAWQIANFTGAAFAGKLRKLSTYIKENKKNKAPKVSREEFDRKLREAERSVNNGS